MKIILRSDFSRVELFVQIHGSDCLVAVQGTDSESVFVRELIRSEFGGSCVSLRRLMDFLSGDSRLALLFDSVVSDEQASFLSGQPSSSFSSLPLGQKLVASGFFDADSLSLMLDEYSRFNVFDRFGDFLSIRSFCPSLLIDFLVNPSAFFSDGEFNSLPLEVRLYSLNLISNELFSSVESMKMALGDSYSSLEYLCESTDLRAEFLGFISSVSMDQGVLTLA